MTVHDVDEVNQQCPRAREFENALQYWGWEQMATRLVKAGHHVTVWNRTASKTAPLVELGATVTETPYAAVTNADVAIGMVRDDEASKEIWLQSESGALAGMKRGAIAIESSTLTMGWVKTLARKCSERHISFLDAPVAGTRPQAEAGHLIYIVGGDNETVERARPLFQVMGQTIHHAGAIGHGTAVKLALNTLFSVQVALMAELRSLLQNSNVNEQKALEIVAVTPVCSPAAAVAAKAMASSTFAPLFPIELVAKDLGYAANLAKRTNAHTPISEATRHVFEVAILNGYGTDNITGVAQLYQQK
ncbi:MAG: NAD(P)-dependent oxidoreductase [Cyanobacteria bacterium P01_E01_bin.34]